MNAAEAAQLFAIRRAVEQIAAGLEEHNQLNRELIAQLRQQQSSALPPGYTQPRPGYPPPPR